MAATNNKQSHSLILFSCFKTLTDPTRAFWQAFRPRIPHPPHHSRSVSPTADWTTAHTHGARTPVGKLDQLSSKAPHGERSLTYHGADTATGNYSPPTPRVCPTGYLQAHNGNSSPRFSTRFWHGLYWMRHALQTTACWSSFPRLAAGLSSQVSVVVLPALPVLSVKAFVLWWQRHHKRTHGSWGFSYLLPPNIRRHGFTPYYAAEPESGVSASDQGPRRDFDPLFRRREEGNYG